MSRVSYIKHVLATAMLLLVSTSLWSADGDTFTANTAEGVSMTFIIISESEKTCQVGDYYNPAIPSDYRGKITIPSSANEYKVTSIGDRAFYGCSGLTSITIPSSVTSIGDYAFYGCQSLLSVSIPSSVTYIGLDTFHGCSRLSSVKIPKGVTYICKNTFWDCSNLESVTIPEGVTHIEDGAFYGCKRLASITIPSSVTSISGLAFPNCSSLTSMIVNEANTKYDSRNNCNAIIETSSNTLIAGCQNTIIPSNVTSIGACAFLKCSGLASITIPSSVTSMEYEAFEDCSSLTSVILPEGLTSIGHAAFQGCTSLTSITIPSSVTSIGYNVFYRCSGLTSVTVCNETPVSIDEYTFSNRANATLYVPYGCKAAYEAADGWKDFKEIVEMPANSLAISDASGLVGCTFNLPVSMKNEDEITAMQFELCLPEGVSIADATLTDRKDGHSIDYSQLANGNYQFTVFSSSSKAINGNEGDVANISLNISNSVAPRNYTIQLKNIELTTTAGDAIHQSDLSATLTVLNLKPGDVNGDDKLSITDAVGIVNYILGKTSANFHPEAADLNGDGGVSITDAVRVVNIILNQGSGVKERRTQEVENEREPQ